MSPLAWTRSLHVGWQLCQKIINTRVSVSKLEDGEADIENGTSYLGIVNYRCRTGFTLVGTGTRTCSANGTWTADPLQCNLFSCSKPEPVAHAEILYGSTWCVPNVIPYHFCSCQYTVINLRIESPHKTRRCRNISNAILVHMSTTRIQRLVCRQVPRFSGMYCGSTLSVTHPKST